ncbi:reverse transcriptase domain-containing protein [Tanacetum coccineum]
MSLISLSFKKIYKPTSNNLITSSNTSRANQDNTLRINRGTGYDNHRTVNVVGARENVGTQVVQQSEIQCYNCMEYGHVARECQKPKREKDAAYHKEKMLLCKQEEARFQLNAEQADWRDDTNDEPKDRELEAHCLHMSQIQEVTLDATHNSGPIYDVEPLQKVQNDNDNYNVFANDSEHPEQPESINVPYMKEHGDTNITTDPLDMSINGGEAVQDEDENLAREHDLLASLINKLKCEIDDSKNRNKILESSNKTLVDKLKGEIGDFETKNKGLELSNNHFKEANNELAKTNQLMFKNLKKLQAELDREYYYAGHMNAILGVYTTLDEFTDLQCDYVDQVVKCERLEKELSKRSENVNNKSFNELSKRFFELEQHSINLELALKQSQEQIKNNKDWKQQESNSFQELNVKYFEIQDLKAQLQDKGIAISELKNSLKSIPIVDPYEEDARQVLEQASPPLSPAYIVDADPKKDPEEDLEEDPADYPADGGDEEEEEESFREDVDDEVEEEDEDEEEEEHLAPADSSAIPIDDPVPLAEETEPFETDESTLTTPSPKLSRAGISVRLLPPMAASMEVRIAEYATAPTSPPSPLIPLSSLLSQIPSPPLPLPSPPTHTSPTYAKVHLGYRAVEIRLRAASPLP